jgi:emfourin
VEGGRNRDITLSVEIEFQRSGGYAGLTLGTKVDTEELPPTEARQLEDLVAKLEGEQASAPKPDRFQYDVTVRRGGKAESYSLGEQDLTPEARELVKRLMERARKR